MSGPRSHVHVYVVQCLSLAQVLGIDPGEERWSKVVDNFKPHLNNSVLFSWSEHVEQWLYSIERCNIDCMGLCTKGWRFT